MSKRLAQYKSGKENLYFFYRFIVLKWELEWTDQKFLLSVGQLQEFCYVHKISLKSFDSTAKLNKALRKSLKVHQINTKELFGLTRKTQSLKMY